MSRSVALGEFLTLDLHDVAVEPEATYRVAGVYGFGRGVFERNAIAGSETSYKRLTALRTDQLVLSRLKAFEGAVAVVPASLDGAYVSQEFPTFSIDPTRALPRYVDFVCRWPDFWELLGAQSKGVGARRERVHPEEFLAIEIPLPDLDEQRRVVARLCDLFSRTDHLNARVADSERVTSALLSAARSQALAQLALTSPTARLGEVAELNMGQSPPGYAYNEMGEGLPLLNGPTEFGPLSPTPRQWTTVITKTCSVGDLLLSVRASIGRTNWADREYCLGRGVAALRARDNTIHLGYLRHVLIAQSADLASLSAGSTFLNLPGQKLRTLEIAVPALEQQAAVAQSLDALERQHSQVVARSVSRRGVATAMRGSILNRAFADSS